MTDQPDPTAGLTVAQVDLYDRVINDWSGRDLVTVVLAEQDAIEADKVAVARAMNGDR